MHFVSDIPICVNACAIYRGNNYCSLEDVNCLERPLMISKEEMLPQPPAGAASRSVGLWKRMRERDGVLI
jgi:hypothetical protein